MRCYFVRDAAASGEPRLPRYGEWVAAYLAELQGQGYKQKTLGAYGPCLRRFGQHAQSRGARESRQLPDSIGPFISHIKATGHRSEMWRCMIRRFLLYLQRKGFMPTPPAPASRQPNEDLVDQYISFLREHRGVCVEYAKNVKQRCMVFLSYLEAQRVADPAAIMPDEIHGFIVHEGDRYTRKTMSDLCYTLRGFLTYLYRRGITAVDLAPLVIAPRIFKQEECPRFLTRSEVQRVLFAVDRRTRQGKRDYAMLCLLSTYGLRGIEVIRLQLKDIDWRQEKLYIRSRKAGNTTVYPLAPAVGNAVLSYLQHGRPKSAHRHVFLSLKAPFLPLRYADALGYLARDYMAQAGVSVERPGTHTFRYSCAQRLLDAGTSLKSIGDYLGHLDPDSTQRYTKIAVEQLRQVALGDGEDLS